MTMQNPFDSVFNNISFGTPAKTASPFDTVVKEEKEKTEDKLENQKVEENVIAMEPESQIVEETTEEKEEEVKSEPGSVEPKPKKRKRRTKAEMEEAKRKAAEESSEEPDSAADDEQENSDVETSEEADKKQKKEVASHNNKDSQIDFDNAETDSEKIDMEIVKNYLVPNVEDPDWDEQVNHIEEELAKLKKFDSEINEGSIRIMIPLYTNLGMYIAPIKAQYDALLEKFMNKDTGLIAQQKAKNAIGANEAERKRNSFNACTAYKDKGMKEPINLFDYASLVDYRAKQLANYAYQIEIAKTSLISFMTLLSKIEK